MNSTPQRHQSPLPTISTIHINNREKLIRLLQIFSAKLVLEVCGGGGAIWGFSEAIGLRTTSNVWFWRPVALLTGLIFFFRWFGQVQEYVMEQEIKSPQAFQLVSPRGFQLSRFMSWDDEDEDNEQVPLSPQNNVKKTMSYT